jgi:16S rRNA (guanine527-N7)-methyltransferase
MTNNIKLVSHDFMLTMKTGESHPQNVSRETFATLHEYVALLLKWNAAINLIGPATESDIWKRHIEDSLQLVSLIPSKASTLVDLGSGGGLPGIVIAIAKPELRVTLIEQDQRKAAFLNEAKARLGLDNIAIIVADIASQSGTYDVVTARALASLDMLLGMAHRLLKVGGACVFPKGESWAEELAATRAQWVFEAMQTPSITHEKSTILTITTLAPKNR